MRTVRTWSGLLLGPALLTVCLGCSVKVQERRLTPPEDFRSLDAGSPYLKAHLHNGRVVILSRWSIDEQKRLVIGQGTVQGVDRLPLAVGWQEVPIDSVAIFETNVVQTSPAVGVMSVFTGVSLALTVYCLSNPKACFGSCPTFYVGAPQEERLLAEGFSASIAPCLEGTDVDALYGANPTGREFALHMTNDALETHVVRHADLLVAARKPGERVFATRDGEFWRAVGLHAPRRCRAEEGDCLDLIAACDGRERTSPADSVDLGAKEILELTFDVPSARPLGLVVAARHSLLSTYLYYQTLAYLGTETGRYLAALERMGGVQTEQAVSGLGRLLGRIEVLVKDGDGKWLGAGEVGETGPLATNVHLLPLPHLSGDSATIGLRIARGNWRLDWIALAELAGRTEAERLPPIEVRRGSEPDAEALRRLRDPAATLMTLPGDRYELIYHLPDDFMNCELFLESRGYYLEWIRQQWIEEQNPALALMMLQQPELALRRLAPAFKQQEPEMEEIFWRSRYGQIDP